MRYAFAATTLLALVTPASAQDIAELYGCTLATAVYRQPTTDWVLRFSPVDRENSSSNQNNAFTIEIPGTGKTFEGGIYTPNGFTTALGVMDLDCPEADRDRGGDDRAPGCGLWQGTVYGDGPQGIGELAGEKSVPPLQVLFPQFAAGLWYAYLPDVDFRNIVPLDAFTFAGCSK